MEIMSSLASFAYLPSIVAWVRLSYAKHWLKHIMERRRISLESICQSIWNDSLVRMNDQLESVISIFHTPYSRASFIGISENSE